MPEASAARVGARLAAVVTTLLLVTSAMTVPAAAITTASAIEPLLLQEINEARTANGKPALALHAGLSAQARVHSQNMAGGAGLNHTGFEARVNGATPDPAEANGAPDDGFTGAACENVAFRDHPGETDQQAADGLVTQWLNSPPHRQCLLDELNDGYNAVGVGVAVSGTEVWATMIPVVDSTPPTGGTQPPPNGTQGGFNFGSLFGGTGGFNLGSLFGGTGGFDLSAFFGGGTGGFNFGSLFGTNGSFNLGSLFGGFVFPFSEPVSQFE